MMCAVLLMLAGCGAATVLPTPATPRGGLRYEVTLGPDLEAVEVSVCGALPASLVPIHEEGALRFASAEAEGADGARTALSGPQLAVPAGARCVHYRARLFGGGGNADAPLRFSDAVYAPTSSWLWAPSPRDPDTRYDVDLHLPEGMSHSALFSRDPTTGQLSFGEAAFRYITYAAFGRLRRTVVPAPGGCIEIAAINGSPPEDALRAWMTSAADAASRSLGHLPHDRISVVALPIGSRFGGGDPLAFGMAAHGERPTLLAYMWSDAPESALVHDWVAVHELSHLGHAFLAGRDAWLTEGIATYYETVLRARAGWVDADTAMRQLDGGFVRGERGGTGRALRDESEDRHRTGAYDRVYWAGAAIALLIDVALRAEGSSLDAALRRAYDRHTDTLSDEELLLALDGGTPGTALRVATPWLESDAFPDVGPAYTALGITRGAGGELQFDASGEAPRRALLNASPTLASNPPDCAF